MSGAGGRRTAAVSRGLGASIGGSAGTCLAVIADSLAADNPWRFWLTVLAPWLAVAIGTLGVLGCRAIVMYHYERMLRRRLANGRRFYDKGIEDPQTPPEQKAAFSLRRAQLNDLEAHANTHLILKAFRLFEHPMPGMSTYYASMAKLLGVIEAMGGNEGDADSVESDAQV